jgi:hypothetical protein
VLSVVYVLNAHEECRIRKYLQTRIEIFLPTIGKEQVGWYGYRQGDKIHRLRSSGNVGAKTVFVLTSLFAVLTGLRATPHRNGISETLLWVAVGATVILTLVLATETMVYDQARERQWVERSTSSGEE